MNSITLADGSTVSVGSRVRGDDGNGTIIAIDQKKGVTLKYDNGTIETDGIALAISTLRGVPKHSTWLYVGAGAGGLGLIALIIHLFRRK